MLNLIYPEAMPRYLERFTETLGAYDGPRPRAMYHDSYEYRSDWAPDLLEQFERRRGYRLQAEFPAFFGKEESDRAARVKCDYRETISDLMVEGSLPAWVAWCRARGMLTRNEAHGSPGNLLDLYAVADIPETEMFYKDRNRLVSKLASSAAHVTGRRLVASETGTWLKEHFTETLADMKYLLDDLFLSGVNHNFYHGTCYSPDEAPWPGWLFYASYEMNPRNPIWRGVPALNAYATRCQAVLQSGQPDADLLLYWPIHDRWHNARGMVQPFTVHAREWLEDQPFGKAAERLWNRGFAFDDVSDRQLAAARSASGGVKTAGGVYRAVVVPSCEHLPLKSLEKLLELARAGSTVVFEGTVPDDVPGWGDLAARRAAFQALREPVKPVAVADGRVALAKVGSGRVLTGDLEAALEQAGLAREPLVDQPGLMFIRRAFDGGRYYFLAHRGDQPFKGWLPLATTAKAMIVMDPVSGATGLGASRPGQPGQTQVYLQLQPGESLILRVFTNSAAAGATWAWRQSAGPATELRGPWRVEFVAGGPTLPPAVETPALGSWTDLGGDETKRYAGTARYKLTFDAPASGTGPWVLDLGRVCQSARVRLNGRDLGTAFIPPYQVAVDALENSGNRLEIEVTSVAANRIRDLDRRKVAWRNFRDINFVNLNYKPFDASDWPLTECGLLGPVRLDKVTAERFEQDRKE